MRSSRGRNLEDSLFHKFIVLASAVIFMAGAFFFVIHVAEKDRARDEEQHRAVEDKKNVVPKSRYVYVGANKCVERPNVETYLIVGTDCKGELADLDPKYAEDAWHSDTILLLAVDREKDKYGIIPINRNTMLNVRVLNEKGEILTIGEAQAAFAYAAGYTREQSCESVVWSVSDYLYGVHIDHYMALSMASIRALNHAAGGVKVKITDDFSESDSSLIEGEEIELSDDQAFAFLHDRMNVDDGTNENRMSRQAVYMEAWSKKMREVFKKDKQSIAGLYDDLDKYMYTNMLKSDASRMLKAYLKDEDMGMFEIEGTVGEGLFGWNTFEADEQSKQEAALALLFDLAEE